MVFVTGIGYVSKTFFFFVMNNVNVANSVQRKFCPKVFFGVFDVTMNQK